MTDSFLFYESFFEGMMELEEADRLALFTALCNFMFYGQAPELTGPAKGMFRIMVPTMLAACNRKEMAKKAADRRWDKKPHPPEKEPCDWPAAQKQEPSKPREEAPQPVEEAPQPEERYHRLGKAFNVCLTEEEYEQVKQQYPHYRQLLDEFSLYKIHSSLGPLMDFPALQHFAVHKSLPKGEFRRPLSAESLRLLREVGSDIIDRLDQS